MWRWMMNFILLVALFGFQTAEYNEIIWQEGSSLSWNDFTVADDASKTYDAVTATGINFTYTDMETHIDISITAVFDRNESYVKPHAMSAALLRHEQLHFTLTEMYARLFREKVTSNYVFSTADLDRMYDENLADLIAIQEQYDEETEHGLLPDKQQEWEDWVAHKLSDHRFFSQSEMAITLPVVAAE